ncbi:hypothetical protein KOAAANKH_03523 [Brevundimonas sp. NIBR10]|uniref:glycosyl hydrolase 108 family protein n=1 Tax=Brevundimonas sp. NIBR10 TaxID=3015997 RepID=UPI0022F1960C|nr:glycosyl hydrolase 108 family protein [Brevundimonas sp. NIBR10]WGM48620.1 hypothetical protein KOAAANKH_03523 [Brevundimonas sp. NIBR10]
MPDTSGYGAAERANAEGLAQAVDGIGRLQRNTLAPLLKDQAKKDATADVLAGRFAERAQVTEYDAAYQDVMISGTAARYASEDDRALDDLVAANPYDPDAFAASARAYRAEQIKTTPAAVVMERAANFDRRHDTLFQNLRLARLRSDAEESGRSIVGRKDELVARITRNAEDAGSYGDADPAFAGDVSELAQLWSQIAENPVLGVAPDQAARLQQQDVSKFQASAFAGHIRRVIREQGPDAALAEIQSALPPAGTIAGDQTASPSGAEAITAALSPEARELARERGMAVYSEEVGLIQQRANIASSARTQASQQTESLIEAMRYGGDVKPEDLRAAAEASGDPGLIARARWAIEVGVTPPEGFGGGGSGGSFNGDGSAAGGFQASVDFVIDQIEGGEAYVADDNGRGPTRFGINASANPDLDIANLTRGAAVNRYKRNYWDAIGADQLPPALALVAFDAAVNHGPADARRWIAESGGDVGQYLALREADYRALAASNPAQARNLNGWLNRLQTVRQRAARIQSFQNTQGGFATDPLAFALGNSTRPALAQVTPVPVEAVFNPQQQGVWGQVMQGRRATGDTLARQYQVPRRMLTDGEVAAYKDRFESDPASVITFAQQATAALGGQGARDLLAEIGQGGAAPVLIHIADIGRPGGDVRFARQAALGLSLKAAGQALDTDKRDDVNAEVTRWRSLLAATPALLSAVQNSAQAAALADDTSGVVRPPEYYVQAALGRTTWGRNTYGGAAEVNGASVVVPRWMNGERFDDVLETLAGTWTAGGHGPVFGNGEPMPARTLARLRPVLQPNGNYQLVDRRGATATRRNGQPFELNLNAARMTIESRLGRDVVRPD